MSKLFSKITASVSLFLLLILTLCSCQLPQTPPSNDEPCEEGHHTFITFTSDGNATCLEDGTKTATCEDCDETQTVIEFGSALGHDYKEGKCTHCDARDPSYPIIEINGQPLPYYDGTADYVILNRNKPFFTESELKKTAWWQYSPLDSLGRTTGAFACICKDTLPPDKRDSISHLKPSGWSSNKSYSVVPGGSLYNRSHLLAHSLMSDDVHIENMVTGTQHMNQKTMQIFEDLVLNAAKSGDYIMYRVTPVYEGDNLICTGVLMEAYSSNDDGGSVEFCVFVYNIQPGIVIDYSTGSSKEGDPKKPNASNIGTSLIIGTGSSTEGGQTPAPDTPNAPSNGVEAGKGYIIATQNSVGTIYFSGTITDGRFDASYDRLFATTVYIEQATGGYYIYFMKNGVKTYIAMNDKAAGGKFVTTSAAASVFEWNALLNTLVIAEDANNRAFGSDATKDYTTMSSYDSGQAAYNWGQYIPVE